MKATWKAWKKYLCPGQNHRKKILHREFVRRPFVKMEKVNLVIVEMDDKAKKNIEYRPFYLLVISVCRKKTTIQRLHISV
jgi:hypothetical protein